ncbi:pyridoxamine 5'-phosphate oxidase family protein [Caulobacter endophyticus]|uniref:pyridoxamine 5'-phosphate oxidase family protein n=1 Tax=Caulobacter endophyticus TaxID=2172652 RepID=UPI00240EA44C|nr:pyridoxamine 5'-phosphate oxidase family protein [Caulobacter endophyticus]MDG2531073.1 pyridoxamine 5'-phosphate oxidase family protein [Caulobacter endophyticus]
MSKEADLTTKFWKALKADRTVMLGLPDVEGGHSQPMTALMEGEQGGPLWIFTSADCDMVAALHHERDAVMHFASKGHDLFAEIDGRLRIDNDRQAIDGLWSPFVAAWFTGKTDPALRLLRFEPEHARIWLNENSLFAGMKLMLGHDPKRDYRDKVAEVSLH